MNAETTEAKPKKPFYKKWWFWLIAILVFFAILGYQDNETYTTYSGTTVLSEEEYKDSCISVNYTDIARNPDNYLGVKAVFEGQVVQVQENGSKVVLRVDVTEGKYGIWEDTVYVDYTKKSSNESRILEEDIITMYGEINGIKTYTAVLGNEIAIPHLMAKYIEIN